MVTWMAYAAGVACLLAAGALSLDKLCERVAFPRRFVWLTALTLALLVPLMASPPEPQGGAGTMTAEVARRGVDADQPNSPIGRTVAGGDPATAGPGPMDRAALTLWGFASLAVFDPDRHEATVVRHEREHARAWDHLALLNSALIVAAMPWNPVVWWMWLRLRTAVEIDCDRRVLASGIPVAEYGDLLLDIGAGRPAQPFFATTLVGSKSMLERRLNPRFDLTRRPQPTFDFTRPRQTS